MDAEHWVSLVLAKAGELRQAGVLSIRCGEMEATFNVPTAPIDVAAPKPKLREFTPDERNWLDIPEDAPGKPGTVDDTEEPLWGSGSTM